MKVLIYCQHILGVGHLFRTLAIARAMEQHRVTLVLGGPPVATSLPEHISVIQLPALQMDADFTELSTLDPSRSMDEVKAERTSLLTTLARDLQPDVALIELFPFGRNGFSFELIPLLKELRCATNPPCKIVSSLRDILVEKQNPAKFENRVIERLNTYFDALLIHGDPKVISLDQTFSRMADIHVPVVYTGYICEKSSLVQVNEIKDEIRLGPDEKLVVVSAGGGNVGFELLDAAVQAYDRLEFPVCLQLFTGPYLDRDQFDTLKRKAVPGIRIERFTNNFPAWLSAADLSISMGGYNTTMNTVAAGTPALILPFAQNREQRLRAEHLEPLANIKIIDANTMSPDTLADSIAAMIDMEKQVADILLDGATRTNELMNNLSSGTLA